jgi:hypothetical protein
MSNPSQDEILKKLEAVADALQAGRITPEEADAESSKVLQELDHQIIRNAEQTIEANRVARGRKAIAVLIAVVLLFIIAWRVLPMFR